ncbi:sensor histidine kinase [Streptomyces sp. IBSNAI002]|uniref:sensor histidine kinase n=1 Tax=Streptomyces sp. IBSNAI002 TaxID=3457500 RepID=UPI003FD49D86
MQRMLAVRMQCLFRIAVILFLGVELVLYPPREHPGASIAIVSVYAVWAILLWMSAPQRGLGIQVVWWTVIVDLVALTVLLTVSGSFSDTSWSSPLMDDALALVPVMAAFQFRARFTLAITVCAAVLYVVGIGIGQGNANPYWDYTSSHALFILLLGAGCALLSLVQRKRVRLIGALFQHRAWLLARIMDAEERERDELAEALHDGALQTVLAARHDIDEAVAEHPSDALLRAERALEDATAQLRSTVTSLHSEILDSQGLAVALRYLAERTAQRSGLDVRVECEIASAGAADRMLHRAAVELLNNVVKHARANAARIRLSSPREGWARLEVSDDGIGITADILRDKAASGHLGISSHRGRIEGAGGTFTLRNNVPTGTSAEVLVPMDQSDFEGSPLSALIEEERRSGIRSWS